MLSAMDYLSLYLHIPFCKHRCGYCDFNTFAGKDPLIPAYFNALGNEITIMGKRDFSLGRVHTIYFGGGTPTLVPPKFYERILNTIQQSFHVTQDVEISIEANPGTVDLPQLSLFRSYGINRISIGAQSFDAGELRLLGRIHNPEAIRTAFQNARSARFSNINLDLIYGLPNQSLETWGNTLLEAVKLEPEHLSLYGLSIEENTPLSKAINDGSTERPDPDLAADMYDWASHILSKNDYEQYEISNWAKKSRPVNLNQCKHNLQYWHNQSYLGFGSAAHSYYEHMRTINECEIEDYIQIMEKASCLEESCNPALMEKYDLSQWDEMEETMMVGLRLTEEGVETLRFKDRFGKTIDDCFHPQIEELIKEGLLEWIGRKNQALRLTPKGRLLGNRVFREFVGNRAIVE
jgi:oxygen-independent coproporphyrinogen-3 oxidase